MHNMNNASPSKQVRSPVKRFSQDYKVFLDKIKPPLNTFVRNVGQTVEKPEILLTMPAVVLRSKKFSPRKGLSSTQLDLVLAGGLSPQVINGKTKAAEHLKQNTLDRPFSLQSVLEKHEKRLKPIHGDQEAIGRIFDDLFTDLAKVFPSSSEQWKTFGNAAKSLYSHAQSCSPCKKYSQSNIRYLLQKKTAERPQTKCEELNLIPQNAVPDKNEPAKKGKKPKPQLRKQLSLEVPKLNLEDVANKNVPDYNDEFLRNFDKFSLSWKRQCKDMKTVATDNWLTTEPPIQGNYSCIINQVQQQQ
eukprot:TRINITY_DN138810_c0_g1_i1.p1 TRINITY_DN138810_c0_g1~~TRINITY_DN138810_c0_g1_i1.p1  ORF type:complete len:302 (-),score=25.39 TRINITY_DN138810_c0_g1_i1:79-984(-)